MNYLGSIRAEQLVGGNVDGNLLGILQMDFFHIDPRFLDCKNKIVLTLVRFAH
jgi:hypothetical protein